MKCRKCGGQANIGFSPGDSFSAEPYVYVGPFTRDGLGDGYWNALFENPGFGNHWITLKLVGTKSNRSAIGARVTCEYGGKRQVQEVMSQSSFYSSNDPRLHFGLGTAVTAGVKVRWPSGLVQTFEKVAADRIVTITEGGSVANGGG